MSLFEYAATVVRVIDGDTLVLDVDLGFSIWLRSSCRLAGVNAIELRHPGGVEARAHLTGLVAAAPLVVRSVRLDKFAGRFDGVLLAGGVDMGARMVADGFAVKWDGSGPRPVPAWPILSSVAAEED